MGIKWQNTYVLRASNLMYIFTGLNFIILALFFLISGWKIYYRIEEFFHDFFLENKYKLLCVIFGLTVPYFVRGFIDVLYYSMHFEKMESEFY